jgi:hypothetical protein
MASIAVANTEYSPDKGNIVTVLSIDGGGIRGIIPATILTFLESKLQVRQTLVQVPLLSLNPAPRTLRANPTPQKKKHAIIYTIKI